MLNDPNDRHQDKILRYSVFTYILDDPRNSSPRIRDSRTDYERLRLYKLTQETMSPRRLRAPAVSSFTNVQRAKAAQEAPADEH